MANERGYNGWSSYESWCVNLWIGNDQISYHHAQGLTRRASSAYELAQRLKDWVEEDNPLSNESSLYSDLLSASLREVNWREIAEHYWEDFREDDEDEEEESEGESDE